MGSGGVSGYHDEAFAKGPGVTIGRSGVGSMGVVCYSPVDYWPHNTTLFVTDFLGNDPRFAFYLLQTVDFRRYNSGSAQASLNRNNIYSIKLKVPNPMEQQAIAGILGSLDDKIECNRRMNRTLETMARAIFQSWFVDFDPVRAKIDGRVPAGLDAAPAALFPEHFEDSELGKVPAGWRVGKIGDLAEIYRRSINPGDSPNQMFDHYSIPAYDEEQLPKAEAGAAIKSNKYVVPDAALLVSKLNPQIRRVWLPSPGPSTAVCSTEFVILMAKSEVSREYLFVLFHMDEIGSELAQRATGTSNSHQCVQLDDMLQVSCVIPEANCLREFTECVRPLFQRIAANRHEYRTLAALRDTLLPKLISGELRVPKAEQIAGRAT